MKERHGTNGTFRKPTMDFITWMTGSLIKGQFFCLRGCTTDANCDTVCSGVKISPLTLVLCCSVSPPLTKTDPLDLISTFIVMCLVLCCHTVPARFLLNVFQSWLFFFRGGSKSRCLVSQCTATSMLLTNQTDSPDFLLMTWCFHPLFKYLLF